MGENVCLGIQVMRPSDGVVVFPLEGPRGVSVKCWCVCCCGEGGPLGAMFKVGVLAVLYWLGHSVRVTTIKTGAPLRGSVEQVAWAPQVARRTLSCGFGASGEVLAAGWSDGHALL